MGKLMLGAIQAAHRWSLRGQRRRFDRAVRSAEHTQLVMLRDLAARNAESKYGRSHGFAGIQTLADWQSRVPVVSYEALEPWVRRAADGEPGVLTVEAPCVFEETSGSTSATKLVPYTRRLLAEFGESTGAWLHDLYSAVPELRGTRSYWSISPVTRRRRTTPGGVAIGFEDDSEYFGPLARATIRTMMAVPSDVARIDGIGAWRSATLTHLANAADLGLISVWHPSFLTLLLAAMRDRLSNVLGTLPVSRAREIERRVSRMSLAEALWPKLAIVSCWADGPAAAAVETLRREVTRARVQAKGVLATEGVVSFPLHTSSSGDSQCVAAITSHVLEFEDLERPAARPVLAHDVRLGGVYAPILSTGGGFYRYRMGDAMRCVGRYHDAPLLEFVGRTDQVSDLCGEKLNAMQVGAAIGSAQTEAGVSLRFALLSPSDGAPPSYRLYAEGIEGSTCALRDALERALRENPGYAYARTLGQLGPVEITCVTGAAARYQAVRIARGERAGNIKPTPLDASLDLHTAFEVAHTSGEGAPL